LNFNLEDGLGVDFIEC